MRMGRRVLAMLSPLALAACTGDGQSGAIDQPINQTASAIKPKIVVQIGHQLPVAAVRWVNGGKHLISLDREGFIVV